MMLLCMHRDVMIVVAVDRSGPLATASHRACNAYSKVAEERGINGDVLDLAHGGDDPQFVLLEEVT